MKHNLRSSQTGRFIARASSNASTNVVPGRLYGYKGTVVRAGTLASNRLRHISFHKRLHGFVPDEELEIIPTEKVQEYLSTVGISVK